MPVTEFQCKTCKQVLPLTEEYFQYDYKSKTGFSIHCKICKSNYQNLYRKHKLEPFTPETPKLTTFDKNAIANKLSRTNNISSMDKIIV